MRTPHRKPWLFVPVLVAAARDGPRRARRSEHRRRRLHAGQRLARRAPGARRRRARGRQRAPRHRRRAGRWPFRPTLDGGRGLEGAAHGEVRLHDPRRPGPARRADACRPARRLRLHRRAGARTSPSATRRAQAVMPGWLASPGHRANIEQPGFVATGIAAAVSPGGVVYWAQEFGTLDRRRGAAAGHRRPPAADHAAARPARLPSAARRAGTRPRATAASRCASPSSRRATAGTSRAAPSRCRRAGRGGGCRLATRLRHLRAVHPRHAARLARPAPLRHVRLAAAPGQGAALVLPRSCASHQPGQRFVIGVRRSRPNAFGRSFTPGGACRRLYSARSTSASARSTTSGSKPSGESSSRERSSST